MYSRSRWAGAAAGALALLLGLTAAPAMSAEAAAPTPPGDVKAANITETTVDLSWTASTGGTGGIASYEIYHDGQFMKSVGKSTLKFTASGLTQNTTYGFYVNAKDTAGNLSQASKTVTVTTKKSSDNTAPTAPSNLKSTGVTANTVSLGWTASTDAVGVTGYTIYSGTKQVGTSAKNSTTIEGLAPNTKYTFTVTARDAAGNASKPSNAATATTSSGGGGDGATPGEVTTVTSDNDVPWGLAFLPDGSAFYSERDTFKVIQVTAGGQKTTVGTVPNVSTTDGEGGLLGLAVAKTFAADHWLYIYHTTVSDNRIVRMKVDNGKLNTGSLQVLLSGLQRNKFHNGGRLRFGPDGDLYVATGDAQKGENAQNLNNNNGKILRMTPDGKVPVDNPFAGKYIWSYGHRNVQGLAFDSKGRLWEAELGNSSKDELNLITKGGNYGWPECEGPCSNAKYINPVQTWSVADNSPSGLTIVNDTLFMAALRGTRLWVMKITGSTTSAPKAYFTGTYGRLRTVEKTPDGDLWLTTSNGDKGGSPGGRSNKILKVALN